MKDLCEDNFFEGHPHPLFVDRKTNYRKVLLFYE